MKNQYLFQISPAVISDVAAVIPLAFTALQEYAHYLAGTKNNDAAMHYMAYAFKHHQPNELHHSNFFIVRDANGMPAASISGYEGYLAPQLSEAVNRVYEELCPKCAKKRLKSGDPPLEREAEDDEFYIDTIAILPEYRGRGLIQLMLNYIAEHALKKGLHKISLIAADYKTNLLKYYEKLGFQSTGKRFLGAATYYHFVKEI